MSELLIGTDDNVFRLGNDGNIQQEEGPPTVAFMTRVHEGFLVVTKEGALWRRTDGDAWQLLHERPIAEDIWAFAADPRVAGRLYLGVSPALLYWSDDGGASWKACEAIRRIPGYESWTFPPPPHIPHVRSVAPDPQVVGAVYIGVEEGRHLSQWGPGRDLGEPERGAILGRPHCDPRAPGWAAICHDGPRVLSQR